MTNKAMLKMAVSSLIFGVTLASCTASTLSSGGPASLNKKAEKSLAKGDAEKAITSAESAVLIAPRDVETRRILAQAYLEGGRFRSAGKTFEDALALGDNSARSIISLTLAQIAQGEKQDALDLLEKKQSILPPSDYGLALALAGETRRGVDVLANLIRSGVNSPKVRQNLAFAYALNGQWREAKLMAGQDIKPGEVNERILQWAQLARPNANEARIATLLGVTPAQVDNGQPVQLALRPQSDNAKAVAIAAQPVQQKAAEPPVTEAKPVALASAAPVALPVPKPTVKPVAKPVPAKTKPVVEKAALAPSKVAASSPAKRAGPSPVKSGTYIIQLGAFSSPASARKAWGQLSAQYRELAPFGNASSSVKSNGRTLYRLAATGFGNEQSAIAMCDGLKAQGGSCIVRKAGGSAASTRLAARR